MKTFAQTIELESEDAIEAYDALHARAWPEILESLRAVGVVDMFIYRSGVRLFMHMTTVDAFDPDRTARVILESGANPLTTGKL